MKYNYKILNDKTILNNFGDNGYKFSDTAEYIGAKDENNKLVGVIGFRKGEFYPELKHIYLKKDVSRKTGIILIKKMERYLKDNGYKEYTAFVKNAKNIIQQYAIRLKMQPYFGNGRGVWFIKQL